jgi:hypothetical protein
MAPTAMTPSQWIGARMAAIAGLHIFPPRALAEHVMMPLGIVDRTMPMRQAEPHAPRKAKRVGKHGYEDLLTARSFGCATALPLADAMRENSCAIVMGSFLNIARETTQSTDRMLFPNNLARSHQPLAPHVCGQLRWFGSWHNDA